MQPSARSSLFSHSFPSFYACYLLKSIQLPTSTATYIGSTPNPPKRIRQHNGELTQGARKTRLRRPWVMQMIVHGFPSKLAALQFEWAWQHAHISRHLRDADGKALLRRANTVNSNIRTVRLMLSTHPWSTWPLHVKLFTDVAVKGWNAANDKCAVPLPLGFTCAVELEGVDGKSGQTGSGRHGPLKIDDSQFTSPHLAKNTALIASNRRLTCSICSEEVLNYSTDHLKTTLCPKTGCTAVSHLSCLSQDFLSSQTSDTGMIPRGGHCKSCRQYILWGDVVRGIYRRSAGRALAAEEEGDDDALFLSDIESDAALPPKSAKAKGKTKAAPAKRQSLLQDNESSGEAFDLNVSSSTESDAPSPRKLPEKSLAAVPKSSPRKRAKSTSPELDSSPAKKRVSKTTAVGAPKRGRPRLVPQQESSEGEAFDFNVGSSTESEPPSPRKRGRPRSVVLDAPVLSPRKQAKAPDTDVDMPDAPSPKKRAPKSAAAPAKLPKRGARTATSRKYHTVAQVNPVDVDTSDFFDSDSLSVGDLAKIIPLKHFAPRSEKKLVLKPGEVDFFDDTHTQEDAISRAMSVLSVASRGDAIILSD
ncbi:Structure-specific endonuclease subunit SLX1 [Mycena sanguinolenta]|uniref:Structure-specific endonuclease subunit SLX1 n=1 Tax=Mycena sanguinolenta TaxID=230812 RepID=A0A8H6ZBD4_9AGAR|nr:Structure-specific endonuclease subunit SLX1 [Mycena sanguinolenta]